VPIYAIVSFFIFDPLPYLVYEDDTAQEIYKAIMDHIEGRDRGRHGELGYNMKKKSVNKYNSGKKSNKTVRHCSNCGSPKHTKNNCNKKGKSRKINYGEISDSSEESEIESSDTQ